ncbi:MAG: hypothetical protein M1833_003235 [Piccolia ochrophora]|nr:MAG: hypothetical protein M1833_003235 [Piccolia ochrophora]
MVEETIEARYTFWPQDLVAGLQEYFENGTFSIQEEPSEAGKWVVNVPQALTETQKARIMRVAAQRAYEREHPYG